jgi:hypothetical protein
VFLYGDTRATLNRVVKLLDKLGSTVVVSIKNASAAGTHHVEVLLCLRVISVGPMPERQAQHLARISHRTQISIHGAQAYLGTMQANLLVDLGSRGVIHLFQDLANHLFLHTLACCCHLFAALFQYR